jgi:hypothetical protein
MSPSSILVLGAGELGTALLQSLASTAPPSTKISVLLRPSAISTADPAKKASLKSFSDLDIAFVSGDVLSQSVPEVSALLKPFDLVISALGFVGGPGLQVKLCRAALEAKVRRYIPWQFGIDYDALGRGSAQPLFDEQLDVRDLLRGQSDVEWTIVSTGMFTSFLFESFFGVVDLEAGSFRALGSWDNRVTVTTPEDIGRAVADVVFRGWEDTKDEVVFVAGETVTYGRVKDVVEQEIGRKVDGKVWSVDFLKDELRKDPEDPIKRYRVVFAEGQAVAWDVERTWNRKRGLDMVDVATFLRNKYSTEQQ